MKRFFSDLRNFGWISVGMIAMSAAWGWTAVAGVAIGLAGTSLNFFGLWGIIRLIAKSSESAPTRKLGGILTAFLFLFKLPILVALMMGVMRIGGHAPGGFLCGLGMVYCWAVGWAESTKS